MSVPISRTPVSSSTLVSVGYSSAEALLEAEFHRGTVYRYLDVPESVYRDLLAAESVGRYFNAAIRGRFPFERMTSG